jgi:hypothetical protein
MGALSVVGVQRDDVRHAPWNAESRERSNFAQLETSVNPTRSRNDRRVER